MNLLTEPVSLDHYLFVSTILLACGLICMAGKRNALGVLMGVELILTAANVNLVAFSNPGLRADHQFALWLDGHTAAIFIMVIAAGEAAVALAIGLNFYNNHATIDVDRADDLKG